MAGYFKKLNGHVYDGSHLAGEALTNGNFVTITANGVKKTTAAKDPTFRVADKTTLWGNKAIVLDCIASGDDEVFMVENEFDHADICNYNDADFTVPVGAYVKMRRPVAGDQIIITVGDTLFAGLNVNDVVTPAADGTVAKA